MAVTAGEQRTSPSAHAGHLDGGNLGTDRADYDPPLRIGCK